MLMLMALRCGVTGHHAVLAGEQIQFKEQFMLSNAPELGEQTVGLIGLGDIGTATARLLRPFGCKPGVGSGSKVSIAIPPSLPHISA